MSEVRFIPVGSRTITLTDADIERLKLTDAQKQTLAEIAQEKNAPTRDYGSATAREAANRDRVPSAYRE